jgi:hypothetical protein
MSDPPLRCPGVGKNRGAKVTRRSNGLPAVLPLRAPLMVPVKPNRAANGGVFQPECGGWGVAETRDCPGTDDPTRSAELRCACGSDGA